MLTVDDLMADLNSSTVFNKLDLSNVYHQLELDESSRYITTFSTHVGIRSYKHHGVNAASAIIQKIIAELLVDIPGARNMSGDIIVHGKIQSDDAHAVENEQASQQWVLNSTKTNVYFLLAKSHFLAMFSVMKRRSKQLLDELHQRTLLKLDPP